MCGIVGQIWFGRPPADCEHRLRRALAALAPRGPDHQAFVQIGRGQLGHTRLSVLDPSAAAHQPLFDPTGRYAVAFNGEIYNYRALQEEFLGGVECQTTGDTEVLLHLLIRHKQAALAHLNGFFAFAFLDTHTGELLLARDRLGIKPLWIYRDDQRFAFASELKALTALGILKYPNPLAIHHYFRFNYVPPHSSILQGAHKLPPGTWYRLLGTEGTPGRYWRIPEPRAAVATPPSYEAATRELRDRLAESVRKRLVADVPLGVFLSGGIDSSTIAALAGREVADLRTFSIGFTNPLYDETRYAEAVAKKIGSKHTVFTLSDDDLYGALEGVLDRIDEPFADASALNVYLLAQRTREHVTVALSGDGADELFGGYSKHLAEARARGGGVLNTLLKYGYPLLKLLPNHRSSQLGRLGYQVRRYAQALNQSPGGRYIMLASVQSQREVWQLIRVAAEPKALNDDLQRYIADLPGNDLNAVLAADLKLVLGGDMLTKVDLMSMAHGLEVRVPFLDHTLVEWACGLPADYKLTPRHRKRILQDAARPLLPKELYNRPKQGFEVPLRDWFLGPLHDRIRTELLDRDRIEAQGIFRYDGLEHLWGNVLRNRGGKADWTLWAVLVFQRSWRKLVGE